MDGRRNFAGELNKMQAVKIFLFLSFVVFGFFNSSAEQVRYVKPFVVAKIDASFLAFRTKLVEAAKKRDAKYVLSVVSRDIKNGFGGNDGIEEFKKQWKIDRADSEFWDEFLPVITNGGKFFEKTGELFIAPYAFHRFPEDLDASSHGVIFGSNVNLRSKADTNSPVVASLSYNIVEILEPITDRKNTEKITWYEVKTLGGKRGFVKAEFVRTQFDYRAGFEKENGKWKMTFFLAGD